MKLPDPENFRYLDCVIGGDECWLITPNHSDGHWTKDNLGYRSVIMRKSDYKIISRGFPKFFNIFQSPDLSDFTGDEFECYEKIDGSCLMLSYHNNTQICRTRGTTDATMLPNGNEIEFLKNKYPKVFVASSLNPDYSILLEWQTPKNIIVIGGHSEPALTLIGCINNESGELLSQRELDERAIIWGVPRPKSYTYLSLDDCFKDVDLWEGKEGVVCYDGQKMLKIKSDWYKIRHRICTGITNVSHVLELFINSPKFVKVEDFRQFITTNMSFEVAEKCESFIKQICEAYRNVLDKIKKADNLVQGLRGFTRKEQAIDIQQHYSDWRVGFCFSRLDGKEMDDKTLRKAIEKELKI